MKTALKCLECNGIMVSYHRHDFVQCSCPNEAHIDGGDDYIKIGAVDLSKTKLFNYDPIKKELLNEIQ